MGGAERRVRAVRLTAPDDALGRRGALLLEDALRTATLPGADGGALYLFRRLDVGVVHPDQGPATLALAIERGVQSLRAQVVHAGQPGARDAPAVFFHDRVEALGLLAARVARAEPTDAWFWPLALPGWSAGKPRDEALRTILSAAAGSETGPSAVAALVATLRERGVLEPLLEALRPEDGPALLRVHGWSAAAIAPSPDSSAPPGAPPPVPSGWMAPLTRWVSLWRPGDPRSTWLAATALIAHSPARILDPALRREAARLVASLPADSAGTGAAAAERPVYPAPAGERPARESTRARADGSRDTSALPVAESPLRGSSAPRAAPAGETPLAPLPCPPDEPASGPAPRGAPPAPVSAPSKRPLEGAPGASLAAEAGSPGDATALPREPGAPVEKSETRSGAAGLVFLLPVLQRLGIEEIVRAHPRLAEVDLPGRVLAVAAARLRVPAGDPCALLLSSTPAPPGPLAFVAPAGWRAGLGRGEGATLHRLAGRPGARLLLDASGHLALALARPGTMPRLRELLAGSAPACGEALDRAPDAELVAGALLTAARRWLRRFARIGLYDLVRRVGALSVTRTHLDVHFDLRAVDIRIRRAGLDLDPGWLPWLGRVVAFHYGYGERDDG